MTLLFAASFDIGSMAMFEENSATLGTGTGRFSTNGIGNVSGTGFAATTTKWLPVNAPTLIVGLGWRTDMSAHDIVALTDAGTQQVRLALTANNTITVYRGTGTANPLGSYSFPAPINDNIFRHFQMKAVIHPTAGSVVVKVNNVEVINLANVNTRATANSHANRVVVFTRGGSPTVGQQVYADDLYICDDTGSVNNDFLGDVRVQARLPNAAGTYSDWSRNTGAANWQAVDEIPSNGDTDYVFSSTAGQKDTYGMQDLTITSGTVLGVQWLASMRKDDAGNREVKPYIKSGVNEYEGVTFLPLDSYKYFVEMWNVDPTDNASWDIARFNALEMGEKLIS